MKKLLTIVMITLAAVAAKADLYLYWMADVTETEWTATTIRAEIFADGNSIDYKASTNWANDTLISDSYSSYWVMLYDKATKEYVAESAHVSYTDIVASTWTGNDPESNPGVSPFTFGGFTSTIPEPTSGLMLLLGLGALALKRKVS